MEEESFLNKEFTATPSSLKKVINHYFPKEFIKNVDWSHLKKDDFPSVEAAIQYILDNSDRKLRMYGSASEIADNLKTFHNFSKCHRFLKHETNMQYYLHCDYYKSSDGQVYICKSDLFCIIESYLHGGFSFTTHEHIAPILSIFLKSREARLEDGFEYVLYSVDIMAEFFSDLTPVLKIWKDTKRSLPNPYQLPNMSDENYIDSFAGLIGSIATSEELNFVRERLREFLHRKNVDEKKMHFYYSYSSMRLLLMQLERMMDDRPDMFLPYSHQPSTAKHFKIPVIVRYFVDGKYTFVIEAELEEAIKTGKTGKAQPRRNIDGNLLYTLKDGLLKEKCGNQSEYKTELHCVVLQFQRTAHVATPIPTNFGMFVICGSDALLQILRRVIFVHKVFQKITTDQDSIFKNFIDILNGTLKLEEKRHYLLNTETFHQLEEQTNEYWEKFLPETIAKDVRNAKVDGFTLENLKNELVHLGLTAMFPDITNFAQVAYEDVNAKKAEKYLRTCDLFAAVENCQLICILKRFKSLGSFIHYQMACDRITGLNCEFCQIKETPQDSTIQKKSNVTVYPLSEAKLERSDDKNLSEIHWKITFTKDKLEVYHNFSFFSSNELRTLTTAKVIKLFLVNKEEFEKGKTVKETQGLHGVDKLMNLSNFSEMKQKTVYLRAMTICSESNKQVVFAQDVLDAMYFLRRTPDESFKTKHIEYFVQWRSNNDDEFVTVPLEQVQDIFCDQVFFPQVSIAIVPDPIYLVARHRMIRDSGHPIMYTLSPDGKMVVHRDQAIYRIFQKVVSPVDWDQEYCQQHPNCMENFKKIVLQFMMSYEKMDSGTFVTLESVNKKIKSLKSMCNYKIRNNQPTTAHYRLCCLGFDKLSGTPLSNQTLKPFILPNHKPPKEGSVTQLKVWEHRSLLETSFVENTLMIDKIYEPLRYAIQTSGDFRIPQLELGSDFQVMRLIANRSIVNSSFLDQTNCLKGTWPRHEQEDGSLDLSPNHKSTIPTTPGIQKIPGPKVPNTSGKERYQEWEEHQKNISNLKKEIGTLNRKVADHVKCSKEVERLKAKLKKGEEREKKLKETSAAAIESRNQLTKKLTQLESELEQQKSEFDQKLQSDKINRALSHSSLENKVVLKNRELLEFQDTNLGLTLRRDEKDRTIQELRDRLSDVPVPGEPVELSEKSKSKIEDYQRLKKSNSEQLKRAERMANRLATQESTRQMALSELSQFDTQLQKYTETINQNIEKIESTNSCSNISPLPDYPSFSQRFLEEYWKLPNDSSEGPSTSGLEDDMECLFCLTEMTKGQENLLKCHECTRFYHIECIAGWIHEKRCCPVCKDTLLDPNEIPNFD